MSETKSRKPPTETPTPITTRSRRPRVRHMYWLEEARIASELGVDFRRLCGVWGPPQRAEYVADPDLVQVVGGLVPITKPRDCQNCARVLEAQKRQRSERGV